MKRTKAGTSKKAAKDRRALFVDAYIANGRNATQAAITAGYAPKSATVTGSQLLTDPKVAAAVAERTEEVQESSRLTVENVLRECGRLALFDVRKLYKPDGSLKAIHELDDDSAAALASIEVDEHFEVDGESKGAKKLYGFHTKKVRFWDKNAALEKAMRHLGLFEKDNRQRDPVHVEIELIG